MLFKYFSRETPHVTPCRTSLMPVFRARLSRDAKAAAPLSAPHLTAGRCDARSYGRGSSIESCLHDPLERHGGYTHIYIYIYIYMCVYVCVYIYIYIYTHTYTHIFMSFSLSLYIYIYIYIYIHVRWRSRVSACIDRSRVLGGGYKDAPQPAADKLTMSTSASSARRHLFSYWTNTDLRL